MSRKQKEIKPFDICIPAETDNILTLARTGSTIAKEIVNNVNIHRKRDLALAREMNSTPNSLPCYLEACLGYIHGDLQENHKCCTKCARGGGRFPFCVTLSDWVGRKKYFGGACVNCRWTNHPEECSLNTTSNRDGKKLRGMVDMDQNDPPGPSDGSGAPDDDDDDIMGEDEPVIETKARGRARGKGKTQVVHDDDDGSNMDEKMAEIGDEDESDSYDHKGRGKQSAIIEDAEIEAEIKPIQPAGCKSTRGVAKPKGKKPVLSSQPPGVKVGTSSAKGKAKEGIKKNPDGSRKRITQSRSTQTSSLAVMGGNNVVDREGLWERW